MNQQAAQQYLRAKVLTSTPEQLQLMLFDGAIRFCEQAKLAIESKKFDESFTLISKAQRIIAELTSSLKHDLAKDLCGKLAALYNYVYRKLVDANTNRVAIPLTEAIELLKYQRETWMMLLDQLGKTKAAAAASRLDMPAPSSRMEASISVQG